MMRLVAVLVVALNLFLAHRGVGFARDINIFSAGLWSSILAYCLGARK